jgi:hypothetical protein
VELAQPALGLSVLAGVLDTPAASSNIDPWLAALSDRCLVARQWWEKHGN